MGRQISEDYVREESFYGQRAERLAGVYGGPDARRDHSLLDRFPVRVQLWERHGQLGEVRILKDLDCSLEGKDLLIVEDILDSGMTLSFLLKTLSAGTPQYPPVYILGQTGTPPG